MHWFVTSLLLVQCSGASFLFPDAITIAKDAYAWKKSLTFYKADNCEKIGKSKKICSHWNNDVEFYHINENGKSTKFSWTDYKQKLGFSDKVLDIFTTDSPDKSVLRVTFGYEIKMMFLTFRYWDKYKVAWGGDTNMVILDPNITSPVGGRITDKGKVIGTIDASYFIGQEIKILDYQGDLMYEVASPFNLDVNPCRKKNPLASDFYRVSRLTNATDVLSDALFSSLVSLLILNFASDSDKRDSCTQWHFYYRWILLVGVFIILIGALVTFFKLKSRKIRNFFKRFKKTSSSHIELPHVEGSENQNSEAAHVKITENQNFEEAAIVGVIENQNSEEIAHIEENQTPEESANNEET